jgi:hypothetical protein
MDESLSDEPLEPWLPEWIEVAAEESRIVAHFTGVVRLADPSYRDRLRESVAQTRRNPLWEPIQIILSDHMAGRSGTRERPGDPGLRDFILLITILVVFLESAARTITPLRPALTMTFEQGITPSNSGAAPSTARNNRLSH